jgi:hypothetical protein
MDISSGADIIQRAVLLQAYKAAKTEYEMELLKINAGPGQRNGFAKARDNYYKVKNTIEALFPVQEEQIKILPATANPARHEQEIQVLNEEAPVNTKSREMENGKS